MIRVVIFLTIMLMLPAMIFAQLSVGPAVFPKSPVLLKQKDDTDNINQFSFDRDVRYRSCWFKVEGLMLSIQAEMSTAWMSFLNSGVR